jgi:hypothetical protein
LILELITELIRSVEETKELEKELDIEIGSPLIELSVRSWTNILVIWKCLSNFEALAFQIVGMLTVVDRTSREQIFYFVRLKSD